MTVALVVVSHSRTLAYAAVTLAQEMLHGKQVKIAVAAGIDGTTFGTDATQVVDAIVAAAEDRRDVVVLMDLGSAVLSAELALELLDEEVRHRVLLCPGPLVEGLVVAAVAAAGGATAQDVAAEARSALAGKVAHLGVTSGPGGTQGPAPAGELTATFKVTNPHGLHARPAARLVQEVRQRDVHALIRNRTTGSDWVPATSLSKIATLGLLSGHEAELRVSGNQAAETLDRIRELAAHNFGQPMSTPQARQRLPVTPASPVGASPGIGIGPARSVDSMAIRIPDTPAGRPSDEWRTLGQALAATRRVIIRTRARTARDIGEAEASIFDSHLLLLEDAELLDDVRRRIDEGRNAASAWSAAIEGLRQQIAALPDDYLQARGEDLTAVGRQVLRAMLGGGEKDSGSSGVLLARELSPAEAAELDPRHVSAVLMTFGSPESHSVILLRAKGIPAVVGAGAAVLSIPEATIVAVDGTRGEFAVDPRADVQLEYLERRSAHAEQQDRALTRAAMPAHTRDGVAVPVGANIGSVDDAMHAASYGADLAGLVRTEFLFLGRSQAPDVDEQVAVYRKIAETLGGRRITLRSADIGGDKPLQFLPTPREANPFLGMRGIRLSLAYPALLRDQLMAFVTVARETPVSVMFPMITTLDELFQARRLLDEAIRHTVNASPPDLRVGIMVEVPAAALKASAFAPHVDFFSIGTNDLTQYALAADRSNDAVASISDPFDPGLLRLVDATCRGAAPRAEVSVCGEFAAHQQGAMLLIGLGVRMLSVRPAAVPPTKEAVRAIASGSAAELAASALNEASGAAVRRRLASPDD